MSRVLILGSGFAGLNAAKVFGGVKGVEVVIIDRKNYHLFQPLLYQVASAALSPAEIAVPIRNIFSRCHNIKVFQGEVHEIHAENKSVLTSVGDFSYDYLIMACGARHFYFGNEAWEEDAPGLKTIEQAHFSHQTGKPLYGIAPVALQQGRCIANNILKELSGNPREKFHYIDKGQLATIGRNNAVLEIGRLKLSGFLAWMIWLFVHIYYLIGFKNKFVVLLQWAYSYLTYQKGARLIVNHDWRFYRKKP